MAGESTPVHPRPFRLKPDASLLAGVKWMSILCLRLTYVDAESAAYSHSSVDTSDAQFRQPLMACEPNLWSQLKQSIANR